VNRIGGWLMLIVSVAVSAVLAAGALPRDSGKVVASESDSGRLFHEGKTRRPRTAGNDCLGPGCHEGAPHRRDANLSTFRNMHTTYVDCLVCHAGDGAVRFEGSQDASGRRHLKYTGSKPSVGDKGHPVLGGSATCRRCHSEAGASSLKARGLTSLPSNYADPIALRMIEGGARRWNP
jgi:hypothetical protein